MGKAIDTYLAAAKARGEVISDYHIQQKYINPETKQQEDVGAFAVTVLFDFDKTVMGITKERNEIQRLERLGPAGKQLREANAARLRQTYSGADYPQARQGHPGWNTAEPGCRGAKARRDQQGGADRAAGHSHAGSKAEPDRGPAPGEGSGDGASRSALEISRRGRAERDDDVRENESEVRHIGKVKRRVGICAGRWASLSEQVSSAKQTRKFARAEARGEKMLCLHLSIIRQLVVWP